MTTAVKRISRTSERSGKEKEEMLSNEEKVKTQNCFMCVKKLK